ncbi:50S ribosomal protein L35 [Scardovia inopinata]|uniref:Large ribosomal subunit protein bL35 n=1 Tax=Scardovia inopinata F0304 TaxID=641146 RepID=W5IK54_SCAIO|nr:50S ribosomal protein L35 [Scardovia inopinata]EFG27282.1 ribosomal protein L35 [Scardovia inopinata F0304]BAR06895.1 50S ribosomal protein L35 [Scardovia inopinata JCM 12537]SUV50960.1 50S ribosomal protein L35 [Scardovia inopinata]
MPKMKSNSAASKRVRTTSKGKLIHNGSAMRHNLENKSAHRRRRMSDNKVLAKTQTKNLKGMLNQ